MGLSTTDRPGWDISGQYMLMMKDSPVLYFDFKNFDFKVMNPSLLPYQLRGNFYAPGYNLDVSSMEPLRVYQYLGRSSDILKTMFASRVLPLNRENAKKILNTLHFSQDQAPEMRCGIAMACRCASLQDNYWTKLVRENETWGSVAIRHNNLSRIVAQIALHGRSLTLQGKVCTPEPLTAGAYAKCWKRESGELYMYKASASGGKESEIEVAVSNILDKTNVQHLRYEKAIEEGKYCAKCKCLTTDDISILSASDFYGYCNRNGLNFNKEVLRLDSDSIYKMCIVDYLIANPDRHLGNWGFYYDCNTMVLQRCHPLYDHNNAFKGNLDIVGEESSAFPGHSLKEMAQWGIKHSDFTITKKVTRKDFVAKTHYDVFKQRCEVLGVKIPRI